MVTGYPDLNVFEYFFLFIKNSMAIILLSSAYELRIIGAEAVSNYMYWSNNMLYHPSIATHPSPGMIIVSIRFSEVRISG